ncbi:endonuclease III domain-containing protein, partial [Salmonella enterica]|uniref:endonuclease III domain-containing protein n=1 Tax=Salmonella enterica TaxID=28901 RepID=UPI003FA74273
HSTLSELLENLKQGLLWVTRDGVVRYANADATRRTGLAPGKTPYEVEMQLLKRIPPAYLVDAHHWLILHGRYVCQARKPRCWECAVAPVCDFRPKTAAP